MKIRTSYVSNSSSSSFILKDFSQIAIFRSMGFNDVKIFSVARTREIIREFFKSYFDKTEKELNSHLDDISAREILPYFLIDLLRSHDISIIRDYLFLDKDLEDGMYITSPVDRDEWAKSCSGYENIGLFMEDL